MKDKDTNFLLMAEEDLLACAEEEHCSLPARTAGGADAEPELRPERASGRRGPTNATDPEEAQGARRRAAVAGEPRGHGVDYF